MMLPSQVIAYLGFAARGNLGDDAIEQALAESMPASTFVPLPLYLTDLKKYFRDPQRREVKNGTLLLGGGTVIGRTNWRVHMVCARSFVRSRPMAMLGAGVEDPAFSGRRSFSGRNELGKWRSILADFDQVTVRGPRSAELLADVGVDAEVVGDPALLLRPEAPEPLSEGLLGINLGWGDDLWGHDPAAVQIAVADALRTLAQQGWRFRLFIANELDRAYSLQCIARAGVEADVLVTVDPQAYLNAVSACTVVLAERLHATILAVAAGVPTVVIEYQPKCRDFARSVEIEDSTLRTDQLTAEGIVEQVVRCESERDLRSNRTQRAVRNLIVHQENALRSTFGPLHPPQVEVELVS